MILHPDVAEGTMTCYCGSLNGIAKDGLLNMLQLQVDFPIEVFVPPIQNPNIHSTRSNAPTVSFEKADMEGHIAKMILDLLDNAEDDCFLVKHLIVDLHVL